VRVLEKDLSKLMRESFAPSLNRLFEQVGSLADELGLPVYLAGGIVRDLLLGHPYEDVDLVVEGDGIQFARALCIAFGGRVTGHEMFGTAAWQPDSGLKIDIATARREHYESPAALPVVEPANLKEDLYRRDFTINAMAIRLNGDKQGWLIDYFHGYRDLQHKKITVLHNLSFVDDPTRIIRAVRFENRLGLQMDGKTLALALDSAENMASVSLARITNELRLLFSEPHPAAVIRRLFHMGLWDYLLPGGAAFEKSMDRLTRLERLLEKFKEAHKKAAAKKELAGGAGGVRFWVCHLAALFFAQKDWDIEDHSSNELTVAWEDEQKNSGWLAHVEKFTLTNSEQQLIKEIDLLGSIWPVLWERLFGTKLGALSPALPLPLPGRLHRDLKNYAAEAIIFIIAAMPPAVPEAADQVISYLLLREELTMPISGADLLDLGLKPGPVYAEIFRQLEVAQLNGELREKEAVLEWVKYYWASGGTDLC
jgi:tRNA nucleotidyltransferase (CCA-adding enzyme)